MYASKIYIAPEDILDRLSPEQKKKFNQCVFTNVIREQDGSVTIKAVLFHDDDPYVIAKHREKYFGEKA